MAAHPSGGEQQEELALALGGSDPDDLAALRQGHEGLRRLPVPSAKASWDSKCHFEKRYPMNKRTDVPGFSGQSSTRDGGLSQSSSALHPLKKLLQLNLQLLGLEDPHLLLGEPADAPQQPILNAEIVGSSPSTGFAA